VLCLSTAASGQTRQGLTVPGHRYIGTDFTASLHYDSEADSSTETMTLVFGPSNSPAFTIDYVVRYTGQRIAGPPSGVESIVTRHLTEDAKPELAVNSDGRWRPFVNRGAALTTTLAFDRFLQFVSAQSVSIRRPEMELVFSAGQLQMLRARTARWLGRDHL
jgi:hypothetical protein